MSLSYISEKLTSAVNGMATSAAPIQTRLEWACISAHTIANPNQHPGWPDAETAQRWVDWWAKITRVSGSGDQDAIQATTSQLSDDEAERLAEELFAIYAAVERAYAREAP